MNNAHTHSTFAIVTDVLEREWLESLKISSWEPQIIQLHTHGGKCTHRNTPVSLVWKNMHSISFRGQSAEAERDLSLFSVVGKAGGNMKIFYYILVYSIISIKAKFRQLDICIYLLTGVTQIALHTADRYLCEPLNNAVPIFESMIALNNICNYCENITMFCNTLV